MGTTCYLTPAEAARRLGVSAKALRIYEARGLVRPKRTSADWRVYGPEEIARLQQIITLKSFGLSLARIAELLSGRVVDAGRFLALHEAMLLRQRQEVDLALGWLASARSRLANTGSVSADELIDLTRKTSAMNTPTVKSEYDAIAAKHLTPEEQAMMKANGFAGMDQPAPAWDALIAEATILMKDAAPESAEAMDLARRWMAQVALATGGSRDMNEKVKAVAREMHEQPEFSKHSKSSNAMMDYVGKAYGAAISAGIMPKP